MAASNYLNKIWNSARYVLSVLPEGFKEKSFNLNELNPLDIWIINRLFITINNVKTNMDKYDFNAASSHLYNFVYDDFCSQYLEMSKVTLNGNDESKTNATYQVLHYCLKNIILLIYPYTPFIGEELYQNLPEHKESIMLESYPTVNKDLIDNSYDEQVETLINLIKDVRNYKLENKLAPNAKLELLINFKKQLFDDFNIYLARFTFSEIKDVGAELINKKGELKVYNYLDLIISNESGKDELIKRLDAEIALTRSEIERCEKMLSNPNFVDKAPKEKVENERNKLSKHQENLQNLLNKRENI